MRGLKMRRLGFFPLSALLVTALLVQGCELPAPEASEAPGQEAMDPELGAVDFPTSCAAEVQPRLEQGLALLHHMMYAQAEESFREAARAEEECAMAHWGVAMTFFQPLWPGQPGPELLAMERLEALEAEARAREDDYWARQIQVQHRSVQAWMELAEGQTEDALRTMRTAAELAAEMEKHPITPGDLQPPHELLGDLLVEAGRLAEAVEAYEASLETWPRRYNSLQGAAEAAEMLGDEDALQEYRSELAALTGSEE